MNAFLSVLGSGLLMLGTALLVLAAWGLITLPDALSRQHATTKAGTLAIATVCAGAFALHPDWAWGWRLGLIVAYLFITLPIASHLLARAAVTEGGAVAEGTPEIDRTGD